MITIDKTNKEIEFSTLLLNNSDDRCNKIAPTIHKEKQYITVKKVFRF